MNPHVTLLHLSLLDGVGPGSVNRLLERIAHGDVTELYACTESDFCKLGIPLPLAQKLVAGLADASVVEKEIALLEKTDIVWISRLDSRYPKLLQEIHVPPAGLYVRGALAALQHQSIAVVGSRDATFYGQEIVNRFVPTLVANGCTIVSGGAYGIDTMAHKKTIECNGTTVVVFGSGLLRLYPAANKHLFERIVEQNGAWVSSFPLTMQAAAHHFPQRNRIISGMARGCLVVQAAGKSGAKITAQSALEEGREVFAVPGSFSDPLSVGCHDMIRQGATLVTNPEEVLQELSFVTQQKTAATQQNLFFDHPLLTHCREPIAFDDLLQVSGYAPATLYDDLFDLQCTGKVVQLANGCWQRL